MKVKKIALVGDSAGGNIVSGVVYKVNFFGNVTMNFEKNCNNFQFIFQFFLFISQNFLTFFLLFSPKIFPIFS